MLRFKVSVCVLVFDSVNEMLHQRRFATSRHAAHTHLHTRSNTCNDGQLHICEEDRSVCTL